MREVEQHRARIKGTLVYTLGGAPNATQRKQLREIIWRGGEPFPTAIMMGSAMIRTVITAINLFLNNQLRTFTLEELEAALQYIRAPHELWPQCHAALEDG